MFNLSQSEAHLYIPLLFTACVIITVRYRFRKNKFIVYFAGSIGLICANYMLLVFSRIISPEADLAFWGRL